MNQETQLKAQIEASVNKYSALDNISRDCLVNFSNYLSGKMLYVTASMSDESIETASFFNTQLAVIINDLRTQANS